MAFKKKKEEIKHAVSSVKAPKFNVLVAPRIYHDAQMSAIDWKHDKHPLPEHVYDVYTQFWEDISLTEN